MKKKLRHLVSHSNQIFLSPCNLKQTDPKRIKALLELEKQVEREREGFLKQINKQFQEEKKLNEKIAKMVRDPKWCARLPHMYITGGGLSSAEERFLAVREESLRRGR